MTIEKEIAEYEALCAVFRSLHGRFLEKKEEIRRLFEETLVLKRKTFLVLAKSNRFTRYLTGRQRQICGVSYRLGEITERIKQVNRFSPVIFDNKAEDGGFISEIAALPREEFRGRRELKQKGLAVLQMIDRVRKNLLQLDLLEMRCRELVLSINKAAEAFRFEYRNICRKLFPCGVLSRFGRALRNFFGRGYFSFGDMDDMAALGNITGRVLEIADAAVI